MSKEVNLLENDIQSVLIKLSLPMIAANFVQTAFGLINMVWIGALGSRAVSSVGTASFYLNLATAISTLVTVGVGIKYAQSLGAKNEEAAQDYIKGSLILTIVISTIYFLVTFIFAKPLINFYQLQDSEVVMNAVSYLRHSLVSTPLLFFSLTLITLLTSQGKTKVTFVANTAGLIANIILDPLLIFGIGRFFPGLWHKWSSLGNKYCTPHHFSHFILFNERRTFYQYKVLELYR